MQYTTYNIANKLQLLVLPWNTDEALGKKYIDACISYMMKQWI